MSPVEQQSKLLPNCPRQILVQIFHELPACDQLRLRSVSRLFLATIPLDFTSADAALIDRRYGTRDALRHFLNGYGSQLRTFSSNALTYQVCCYSICEAIARCVSNLRCLNVIKWHVPLGLLHQLPHLSFLRAKSLVRSEPTCTLPSTAGNRGRGRGSRAGGGGGGGSRNARISAFVSTPAMDVLGAQRLCTENTIHRVSLEVIDADVVNFICSHFSAGSTDATTPRMITCVRSLSVQFEEGSSLSIGRLAACFPTLLSLSFSMAEVAALEHLPCLSQFQQLTKLSLARCELGGLGPGDMLPGTLTSVELYRCYNVRSRILLSNCHCLQELTFLRGNLLPGFPSASEILENLPQLAPLSLLAISDTEIMADEILDMLLHRSYPLKHLEVRQIRGTPGGFDSTKLSQYLSRNTEVVYLYLLNHSTVNDSVLTSLGGATMGSYRHTNLSTLILNGTGVTCEGIKELCRARSQIVEQTDNSSTDTSEVVELEIQVDSVMARDASLRECAVEARIQLVED